MRIASRNRVNACALPATARGRRRARRQTAVSAVATFVALNAVVFAAPARADFSGSLQAKCTGSSILGWGTAAQTLAHGAWYDFWRRHTSSTKTRGCGPRARQVVLYGAADPSDGPLELKTSNFGRPWPHRFIGLDEAPDAARRASVQNAAGHDAPAKLAVAPAAQSALTMIVNFPRHCQLTSGDPDLAPFARFRVSNDRLMAAWAGDPSHDEWGELLPGIEAIPGNPYGRRDEDCRSHPITRVAADTTAAHDRWFKLFLHRVAPWFGWNSAWSRSTWPHSPHVLFARQTQVAHTIAHTPGSIGYTDLAAARAAGFQKRHTWSQVPGVYTYSDANHERGYRAWGRHYSFRENLFWIPLEKATASAPSGSGEFAEPTIDQISIRTGRKGANCRYATYSSVPLTPTSRANPYGDWSQASAILAPGGYPLCVLTYIAFWDDPSDVYGDSHWEQARARTVKDYLTTTFYSGQNILFKHDYAPVPVAPAQDLRWAARYAAAQSGWNKP